MNIHVAIEYHARQKYNGVMREWLVDNMIDYRVTSLMDSSEIGMSFLYSFNTPEEALAFKLQFSEYTVS